MAMVQVVVTLTETDYKVICKFGCVPDSWSKDIGNAIKEGVVLPHGHGKLLDASKLRRTIEHRLDGTIFSFVPYLDVDTAPTIIEADKEVEHETDN